MEARPFQTILRITCCLIIFLAESVCPAAPWPDDAARAQTLRLLPDAATSHLIAAASRKTAWFFYGLDVVTRHAESNQSTLAIDGDPDSHLGAALAVAIDQRGYFLTADHVLVSPAPFSLVFHDGSTFRSAPARVVARMPRSSENGRAPGIARALDLALLHVENVQLASVFAWAEITPKPRRDSVVVQLGEAKGRFSDTNDFIQFSAVAGRFRKLASLRSGGFVIQSMVPGRPGDSGGPLLNADGELLAITSGLDVRRLGPSLATATRPDLGWLRDTVENDQRRSPLSLPANAPLRKTGKPAHVTIRFTP